MMFCLTCILEHLSRELQWAGIQIDVSSWLLSREPDEILRKKMKVEKLM